MSRHKTSYVISYHGILCHDMSYVTTIAASLVFGNIVPVACQEESITTIAGAMGSNWHLT